MASRIILRLLGVLLCGVLFGAGGWYLWRLRQEGRVTDQRLQETQRTLEHTQETLVRTEEERSELIAAYDDLKARLRSTDEELAQLKQTSAQITAERATLTKDRTALTEQLEETTQQASRLQNTVEALEHEYAAIEAENVSLEQQLQEAASAAPSPSGVQQLTEAVAESRRDADRLRDQMVVLSRAYEQAAQAPSTATSQGATEAHRSAQRYRRLGDTYLATYQYPKAADAYEQALKLKDDPEMHTRLAFLYSRLLHNPQKAQRHAALAPARDPASSTLGVTPGAQGLPRKGWSLLWNWLTQ